MAEVITSIGTDSSIDTETPASGSGSNPYVVTFSNDPTGVSVGDSMEISDGYGTTYNYLVTDISGSDYTLKYISGGWSATNPYGITDMSYAQSSGTFKRTYSTISAWDTDLDNTAYYSSSDDAVGEVYNDSVFDEYIVIDGGGTVGLSSVTLTVPESERHDGKAGTGARIEYTGNQSSSFRIRRSQCTVEWLELDLTSTNSAVATGLNFGTNSTQEVYARNNIIHGLTTQSTHIHGVYIWGTGNSSNTRHLMNNIIYNMDNSSSSKSASGVTVSSGNWGVYLYNNTVYNIKSTAVGDDAFCFSIHDTDTFIKNNIAARPSAWHSSYQKCFAESGFSGSTHDYNLSTDSTATGTNSVTGEDYADLFVSITGGTEDLHLEEGADAINAGVDLGTSPTGVNIDIDGFDRDTVASWDIGANEYVPTPVSFSPTAIDASIVSTDPTGVQDGFSFSPTSIDASTLTVDPTGIQDGFSFSPSAIDASALTVDPTGTQDGFSFSPTAIDASIVSTDPTGTQDGFSFSPTAIDASALTVDPTGEIEGSTEPVEPDSISFRILTTDPAASSTYSPASVDGSIITSDPTGTQDGFSFSPSAIDGSIITSDPTDVFGSFVKAATAVDASIITSDPSTVHNGFTASIDSIELSTVSVDPSSRIDTFYSPDSIELSGVTVEPDDVFGSFNATPDSIIVKAQTNLGRADLFGLWYVDQPYIERAEASGLIYRATITSVSIESVTVNQPTIEVK